MLFLGYIISTADGIQVDEVKIYTIRNWSTPTIVMEVQSFIWLVTFYRRFIHHFSTIVAPITDCYGKADSTRDLWQRRLLWRSRSGLPQHWSFIYFDFLKPFELECDLRGIEIGVILSQDWRSITYYSKRLSEPCQKLSTYQQEIYTVF